MQNVSSSASAGFSCADTVVPVHASVDALSAVHAIAANDAIALPFGIDAVRMRDAYFDHELI
jgi:hypothetical protein